MGIIQRGADLFYTFRFIKLLVTQWKNTDAYKLGIVDDEGKQLKKVNDFTTDEEKSAYTLFHRLVYNMKRLINKLPLIGKTRLATLASALWLIKEETGMSETTITKLMEKYVNDNNLNLDTTIFEGNNWLIESNGDLRKGTYTLLENIASPKTGEIIARPGTDIRVIDFTSPIGSLFGSNIYEVLHIPTKQYIFISVGDIVR
tara:strand:+ start:2027 stop:2632 length:606 start_codon:yes stop_codon:yes gene_type:complete